MKKSIFTKAIFSLFILLCMIFSFKLPTVLAFTVVEGEEIVCLDTPKNLTWENKDGNLYAKWDKVSPKASDKNEISYRISLYKDDDTSGIFAMTTYGENFYNFSSYLNGELQEFGWKYPGGDAKLYFTVKAVEVERISESGYKITDNVSEYATSSKYDYKEKSKETKPVITTGKKAKWTKGSNEGLVFKSTANKDDLIGVFVDSKKVKENNYEVREGSTIIELKNSYVSTLAAGEHAIVIKSKTGDAVTTFTIQENSNRGNGSNGSGNNENKNIESSNNSGSYKNPKTGEDRNILIWLVLWSLSLGILAIILLFKKTLCKKTV